MRFSHISTFFCCLGMALLSFQTIGTAQSIEDFETGTWPWAPWTQANGTDIYSVVTAAAHDGTRGMADDPAGIGPAWFYRTDVTLGNAGDILSIWVRPFGLGGRYYLGIGADSVGCICFNLQINDNRLIFRDCSSYGSYSDIGTGTAYSAWSDKWYYVEVEWITQTNVEGRLYDTNGTTLLASVNQTIAGLAPGGIALRSFDGWYADSIGDAVGQVRISNPTSTTLPAATEGQLNYSVTFEAAGGTAPYTWSNPAGNLLPTWLDFFSTSGTPVSLEAATVGTAGSYDFDIQVADSTPSTDSDTFTLEVNPPPEISSPGTLPEITETGSWPTPVTFSVTYGTAPHQWTVAGVPAGMTINASGELNGPPNVGTAGIYNNVIVTVTDANGVSDSSMPMTLTVNPEPSMPSSIPDARVGIAYNKTVTAQAGTGTPPLTYSIVTYLPLDIGISVEMQGPDVVVSGIALRGDEGVYTFTIQVTDTYGATSQDMISLTIIDNSSGNNGSSGCFVATASAMSGDCVLINHTGKYSMDVIGAHDVASLRCLRQEHLLASQTGRDTIATYERISPVVAQGFAGDHAATALTRTTVVGPAALFARIQSGRLLPRDLLGLLLFSLIFVLTWYRIQR